MLGRRGKRTKLPFNPMKYKGSKMHRNSSEEDTQPAGKPVKRRSHLQSLLLLLLSRFSHVRLYATPEVCRSNPREGPSGTKFNSKILKKGQFQVLARPWADQTACPQQEGREAGWSLKLGAPPPPGPASPARSSREPAPLQPRLEVSAELGFVYKRKTLPGPRTEAPGRGSLRIPR